MLCRESNSEVVQSIEANMKFAFKSAWDTHKNRHKVKGTCVQACEEFFRPPNKTAHEKVVASRLECHREDREVIVVCGASLHMMSKNAITSGDQETIRKNENTSPSP